MTSMNPKPINQIKRYPLRKNDLLQGWDSADQLILDHMSKLNLAGKRILILNDQFGALTCGLEGHDISTYTDSFVSYMGILQNSEKRIQPLNDLNELSGIYDYVLIQMPKNMSFFEDILAHLTDHLHLDSQIICGVMVKHQAATSFDLLQKYIGNTSTSLAHKKARLIFAHFEKNEVIPSPYPQSINIDSFPTSFTNHSNLFSREKLDIGTRFFLEHIPKGDFKEILDLGCANGIIGIKAKMNNPHANIHFSDESAMAIKSAKTNYSNYFEDQGHFYWTNCFENQKSSYLDLVLCNPPFHQGNTIGDFIAYQMFQDAYHSLKKGGIIRVIGNSHLGYQVKLKKIFGNSQIIATNKKFMICNAAKSS